MKIIVFISILAVLLSAGSLFTDYGGLKVPSYFPKPVYNFTNNTLTEEKILLGRALFYEPMLSKDNTISCASCHSPYNAFAHTDHDLSHGIKDEIGTRNAPALFNLAWQTQFMWDGAINHLDMQALAPISHPKEMGETLPNVIKKLSKSSLYTKLFSAAYGADASITGERMLKALSQFQLTLVSANSKYDQVRLGKEAYTDQEASGYTLFKQHCNSCHQEPLFTNSSLANNGLSQDTTLKDQGRYSITQLAKDSLLFKVPSLRNLSYTYPYMHDGRFQKLSQVINHYTSHIVPSSTLSDQLRQPILLTSNEKVDLVTFLLTLNDKEFVFHPNHAYPTALLQQN